MSETILVTGADGFIGGHLVDFLRSKGRHIRCLRHQGKRLQSFHGDSATEIVSGDLKSFESLLRATQNCETVFHLAALSRFDVKIPDSEYRIVNVEGTKALLEACRRNAVRQMVYLSSIEAIGLISDGRPHSEDAVPNPRNIYGRSKLEAERALLEFHRKYDFDCRIVRIGATYGARERLMFQRLFKPISKGFYAVINNGSALMEFGYVKNQLHGLWTVSQKGRAGETYFISDSRPYSFREVVEQIASQMGVRLRLLSIPTPVAWTAAVVCEGLSKVYRAYPFYVKETGRATFSRNTLQWAANTSLICDTQKARTELGYLPNYSLSDGLRETIQWYRDNHWL